MNSASNLASVGHLICGEISAASERSQDVYNPATGQVIRKVCLAGVAEVEAAIASAEAAFPAWRNTGPAKRARVMFKFKELLEQNADEIASLLLQQGRKGNTVALIWLSKAMLGWSEKGPPTTQTNIQIVLNDAKSEDAYLRTIDAEER